MYSSFKIERGKLARHLRFFNPWPFLHSIAKMKKAELDERLKFYSPSHAFSSSQPSDRIIKLFDRMVMNICWFTIGIHNNNGNHPSLSFSIDLWSPCPPSAAGGAVKRSKAIWSLEILPGSMKSVDFSTFRSCHVGDVSAGVSHLRKKLGRWQRSHDYIYKRLWKKSKI